MSQEAQEEPIAKKTVVYQIPGMEAVTVRRDVVYQAAEAIGDRTEDRTKDSNDALTLDLYSPPDAGSGARVPAVVIVAGYPDAGFQRTVGCRFKEMGSSTSWGRLIAASGMVAITYANR